MRLYFEDDRVYTGVTIIGSIDKRYGALIDTGAFKSGLPFEDCKELKLEFAGTHTTSGLFGEDVLPMFHCQFDFGDNDLHLLPVLAIPLNQAVIGRDILSKYKLIIDWTRRTATAERLL